MNTTYTILIGVWCILVGFYSATAALDYDAGKIGSGVAHTIGAILWAACIIIKVANPV